MVTQKSICYKERLSKMNTQQIQFNRQRVVSLLVAGLIVAVIAILTWTWADTSGSTSQLTNVEQSWSQLSSVKGSKLGTVMDGNTGFLDCDSQLSSDLLLTTVQGRKLGAGMDRTGAVGCENGSPSWPSLRSTKAGKMGGISGGID
jgi:hypothetical protein